MTNEDAIDKATRLLRLAKSDNPHEAASAAAMAQAIIDRYKLVGISAELESASPVSEEPILDLKAAPLEVSMKLGSWVIRLAKVISEANQCRNYTHKGSRGTEIRIVGRPSDAEAVRYLFAWLRAEVNRLAERDGRGLGKTWRNNFRIGVVQAIGSKLHDQARETQAAVRSEAANPHALVRVNQAIAKVNAQSEEVKVWMGANIPGLRTVYHGRSAAHDPTAREAGVKAGQEINLSRARVGLGSGAKLLGGGQ